MNRKVALAFMVWAIDIDALSLPVDKCWEMFQRDAWNCYKTFTNPNDDCYCKGLVGKDPIDVFTDYTLGEAKCLMISGICSYGKYDERILNYERK